MKGKKETRHYIVFAFESIKDQKEVLAQMKKKRTITWSNDSKEAAMSPSSVETNFINVSKSKISIPKPIRL